MRIAIEASSAVLPQKTGVAKYIQRLIEYLEDTGGENEHIIYYHLPRIFYRFGRWKRRKYFYQPKKTTTKVRVYQKPFISGKGIDVFHGPDVVLPKVHGPKLVATIHDLFSLVSDQFADERFRRKKIAQYHDTARRADRIICVSESTRQDFIRFFPEAEQRTCVIHEGVDECFFPRQESEIEAARKKYGIRSDYMLYVGALSKRKNLLRMLEAFQRVRERVDADLQFVIAGKSSYGWQEVSQYIEETDEAEHILLLGYVPDDELAALYSDARLFVFTTLYEGFGLPILEALACGTPVLTSNISAMNEIGAEATFRVSPTASQEIADAMEAILLLDTDSRKQIVQKGFSVSKLSWREIIARTLAVYHDG